MHGQTNSLLDAALHARVIPISVGIRISRPLTSHDTVLSATTGPVSKSFGRRKSRGYLATTFKTRGPIARDIHATPLAVDTWTRIRVANFRNKSASAIAIGAPQMS
jgi:hypothetical protein